MCVHYYVERDESKIQSSFTKYLQLITSLLDLTVDARWFVCSNAQESWIGKRKPNTNITIAAEAVMKTLAWLCEIEVCVNSAGVIDKRGQWVRCEKR